MPPRPRKRSRRNSPRRNSPRRNSLSDLPSNVLREVVAHLNNRSAASLAASHRAARNATRNDLSRRDMTVLFNKLRKALADARKVVLAFANDEQLDPRWGFVEDRVYDGLAERRFDLPWGLNVRIRVAVGGGSLSNIHVYTGHTGTMIGPQRRIWHETSFPTRPILHVRDKKFPYWISLVIKDGRIQRETGFKSYEMYPEEYRASVCHLTPLELQAIVGAFNATFRNWHLLDLARGQTHQARKAPQLQC